MFRFVQRVEKEETDRDSFRLVAAMEEFQKVLFIEAEGFLRIFAK